MPRVEYRAKFEAREPECWGAMVHWFPFTRSDQPRNFKDPFKGSGSALNMKHCGKLYKIQRILFLK